MRFAFAVLALLTSLDAYAAPVIHGIRPGYAFRFGPSHVTITGSGFAEPVQVFVGDVPAVVREVTPTSLRITIVPSVDGAPRAHGEEAALRIVMPGVGAATMARAVTFVDSTEGAENYVLYLVPFTTEIIPGANGSRWTGELTFYNGGVFDSEIAGSFSDPDRLSPPGPLYIDLHPGQTMKPDLFASGVSAGAFVQVPKPLDETTMISLRVRDLSRNAASWGTDIPIVAEEDTAQQVTLIDIPTDPQYRAMLRIYHWSGLDTLPSRVTIYSPDHPEPVATFDVTSTAPGGFWEPVEGDLPFYPSYAQIDLLTPAVRAAGPTIRVEVDNKGSNVSPPLPSLWAFVSVTNNDTQQVTIMTPR
ncbi:MAG TPA: IPT/TIG domain-containing protein [Thermoanaerobaculia bacterium]|nr:IPT/TIG domain-containing protein [Thermoanaerobaculia bacterium]